jgi:hypothetical protein
MLGAKVKALYEAEAKERMREGGRTGGRGRPRRKDDNEEAEQGKQNSADPIGQSRDKAASAVNVSHYSIDAGSKVIANGTAELQHLVEADAWKGSARSGPCRAEPGSGHTW